MDAYAHKCNWCKKAYHYNKVNQQYCSSKCRQAAYRHRKAASTKKPHREEQPYLLARCEQCQGTFWAKRHHARFCSISCRSLAHRYMKSSLPQVLSIVYGIPEAKAADLIETQPIRKLRGFIENAGYRYSPTLRNWSRVG